jgi:hypothetical protein
MAMLAAARQTPLLLAALMQVIYNDSFTSHRMTAEATQQPRKASG